MHSVSNLCVPFLFVYSQTLCALFRGVHQKNKSASGFDIINMLMGFDKAELRMKVCEGNREIEKMRITEEEKGVTRKVM